jgi:hypothetical protein
MAQEETYFQYFSQILYRRLYRNCDLIYAAVSSGNYEFQYNSVLSLQIKLMEIDSQISLECFWQFCVP